MPPHRSLWCGINLAGLVEHLLIIVLLKSSLFEDAVHVAVGPDGGE